MFWCGIELQKQEQAFISCGRDYSPTEGSITGVPVISSKGGVGNTFVSPSEKGVASVSVSSREGSVSSLPVSLVEM